MKGKEKTLITESGAMGKLKSNSTPTKRRIRDRWVML
jgi:hypothetical protein